MPSIPDLHPYDGLERRFRHTDIPQDTGLAVVAHLLHLPAIPQTVETAVVRYDLSFYSGGIGVYDQLAISLPADNALWARVGAALDGMPPEEAACDPRWGEDFAWLVSEDVAVPQPRQAAAQFINQQRAEFQTDCGTDDRILFARDSGGNSWTALWGTDQILHYRSFDQG